MLNRLRSWMLHAHGSHEQMTVLGRSPVLRRRIGQRCKRIGLASLLGAIYLVPSLWMTPVLSAQSPVTWTETLVLAEPATSWSRPSVAADPWGRVHVVWSDRYGGAGPASEQSDAYGDTLYHAYWDGWQWSEPLDIIIGATGDSALAHPEVTVDAKGQIYLTWSARAGLYFDSAPALGAHDAASWQSTQVIAEGSGFEESRLIANPDGRLHVVSVKLQGDQGGNLLYTTSEDGGVIWSSPIAISEVYAADDTVSVAPEMVRDGQGWLHVVWSERSAPDWIGQRVLYARSEDDGATWTRPIPLAQRQLDGDWEDHPSLATTGDGNLHLVWVCGEVERCYRVSLDGGRAWSRTERILVGLRSSAGGDALVADYEGNLHLIAQLRYPNGIYYASKPYAGSWQRPVLLVSETEFQQGHFYRSALSEGNQLHGVWQKASQDGDVVYLRIVTRASPLSPVDIPTMSSVQETVPSHLPTQVTEPPHGQSSTLTPATPAPYGAATESQLVSPAWPILWAVLPAAMMIALVVGLRLRGKA